MSNFQIIISIFVECRWWRGPVAIVRPAQNTHTTIAKACSVAIRCSIEIPTHVTAMPSAINKNRKFKRKYLSRKLFQLLFFVLHIFASATSLFSWLAITWLDGQSSGKAYEHAPPHWIIWSALKTSHFCACRATSHRHSPLYLMRLVFWWKLWVKHTHRRRLERQTWDMTTNYVMFANTTISTLPVLSLRLCILQRNLVLNLFVVCHKYHDSFKANIPTCAQTKRELFTSI